MFLEALPFVKFIPLHSLIIMVSPGRIDYELRNARESMDEV